MDKSGFTTAALVSTVTIYSHTAMAELPPTDPSPKPKEMSLASLQPEEEQTSATEKALKDLEIKNGQIPQQPQASETNISQVCQCCVRVTELHSARIGKTATATVHIVDQESREYQHPVDLSCELVSSDGQNKATAIVQKTKIGKYQVSFQPQMEDSTSCTFTCWTNQF